jgi:hypothetical protein
MKKYIIGLLLIMLGGSTQAQAQVLITGFGTSGLNNTTLDYNSPWTGAQNGTSLSVSGVSNQSGGLSDVFGTPINIAGSTAYLQLTGGLTGAAPTTNQFQITLFDSSFDSLAYKFNWSSFGSGPQTVTASLDSALDSGTFNGTVSSWDLSLFGSNGDTVSYTFDSLSANAVPEPSTYALLGLGLGVLGFGLYHRRQKHSSVI